MHGIRLGHYVVEAKQKKEPYASLARVGPNLRGLIRILLFKRFESSVFAFQETVRRLTKIHERFLKALDQGIVPAGEDAQEILYGSDKFSEVDLIDALREVSKGKYNVEDFNISLLTKHIQHDLKLLYEIGLLVESITPDKDAKLKKLKTILNKQPLNEGKWLIFTEYADTARYLYDNLNPGGKKRDMEVIYSGENNKGRIVGRFAPKANPQYVFKADEVELNSLIATDVLAEGLNLQDCDKIINYDLHWNPVRLIQRFGRIDRIGSEHSVIFGFNFLPETGIEKNLGLKGMLQRRIQEIHDTIGEDSAILDRTETLNEEAMYAIYEKKTGQISLFEDADDELLDLNEAEEIIRQLRKENPAEYERIANLRDGIRAAKLTSEKGLYVFCQAGRFQQLFLLDENGKITSRDISTILGTIKCGPTTKGGKLPKDFNSSVMKVKQQFEEEVKHRQTGKEYSISLSHGQRYVLRELRLMFGQIEFEDQKAQINILEKAFRGSVNTAINRELNLLRRNATVGDNLLKQLIDIYHQYGLKDLSEKLRLQEEQPIPKIVCSEWLG